MPKNPRGLPGLAAVIRYIIELKTWTEMGKEEKDN